MLNLRGRHGEINLHLSFDPKNGRRGCCARRRLFARAITARQINPAGSESNPLNRTGGSISINLPARLIYAMAILLLILFLAMIVVDVWAAVVVIFKKRLSGWLRSSYFIITLLAFVAAFAVTSFFSYYSNPNTHIFGWPVPRVIFQRDTPTSPWLDYVGPTILLAYPMNFVVYMSIPSVAFIILAMRRRRKHDHVTAV